MKNTYKVDFYATNKGANRATIKRNGKLYMDIPQSDIDTHVSMILDAEPKAIIEGYSTFTLNEYYQDCIAEERDRQCNKCCMNCNSCFEDYGYIMCKHDLMDEEADPNKYVCDRWN